MTDVDNDVRVRAVIGLPIRDISSCKFFALMGRIKRKRIFLTLGDKSDIQWARHQTALSGIV